MIYFLISTLVGLTETDIVIQHQNVSSFAVEYSNILKKTNLSFCDDLTKKYFVHIHASESVISSRWNVR